MKNLLKNIAFFCIVSALSASCDMNKLHDEYLKNGETHYIAKFDSVKYYQGYQRLIIRYWLSDPLAKHVEVTWGAGTESERFDVALTTPETPGRLELNDLSEGSSTFNLTLYNEDYIDKSITVNSTINIFGQRYSSSLNNRALQNVAYNSGIRELTINWISSVYENSVGTEITYISSSGEQVDTVATPDDSDFNDITVLQDVAIGSDVSFRTLYIPVNCIDTLASASDKFLVDAVPSDFVFPPMGVLGESYTITGTNLNLIGEVWLGSLQAAIVEKEYGSLTVTIPATAPTGETAVKLIYGAGTELAAGTISILAGFPTISFPDEDAGGYATAWSEIGEKYTLTGKKLDLIEEVLFDNLLGTIADNRTDLSIDVTIPAGLPEGDTEIKVIFDGGSELIVGKIFLYVKNPDLARYAGSRFPDVPRLTSGRNPGTNGATGGFNLGGGRQTVFAFDGCFDNATYELVDYARWYSANQIPNVGRTYWQGNTQDKMGEIPNGQTAPSNYVWFTLNYSDTRSGNVTFDKIMLSPRANDEIVKYTVEISDDNLNWTKVVKAEDTLPLGGGTANYTTHQLSATVTAKYVRFVCVERSAASTNGNVGLTNFQLYNTTVAP